MPLAETVVLSRQKRIADVLTLSRLPIAVAVFVLGAVYGEAALGIGLALVLVGWTTDIFDGRLARSDPNGTHTAIGDADMAIDLVLDVAGFYLIVFAVNVPWLWAWATVYVAVAAAVSLAWPKRDVVTWFELPVLALHPIFAFIASPILGWFYVAWMVGAVVINWKRTWELFLMLWNSLMKALGKENREEPGEAA
jgi:phosphatidylglycerophosphate synthase